MDKRIVLWFGDFANNNSLAWEIEKIHPVSGIVFERRKGKPLHQYSFGQFFEKLVNKIRFSKIDKAWNGMLNYYKKKHPAYPDAPILFVENINSDETIKFTRDIGPDLIMVSGTRLIRKELLSLDPSIGIINLHTGLSPYINGGPNCANWCLASNELHLIGNTVMWINAGIDSGNIISTEVVRFEGNEDLNAIHLRVIEWAHHLYLQSLKLILQKPGLCPNVQQEEIGKGITYYNKMWGSKERAHLLKNMKYFKKTVNSPEYKKKIETIKTVHLPDYEDK